MFQMEEYTNTDLRLILLYYRPMRRMQRRLQTHSRSAVAPLLLVVEVGRSASSRALPLRSHSRSARHGCQGCEACLYRPRVCWLRGAAGRHLRVPGAGPRCSPHVLPQNAERATPPQLAAGRSPRLRVNDLGGGLRSGESRFRLGLERWVALRKRSQRLPSARLPVPALRTRSARSFRD